MKQVLIFVYTLVLLASCTKKSGDVAVPLEGTWKFVEVYNNGNLYLSQPPGDIILTFAANGTYSGHTLVNTFSNGTFVVEDGNKIKFDPPHRQTQVVEEDWGRSLFEIFYSCLLQSVAVCVPFTYTIQGDQLFIKGTYGSIFVFRKL